MFNSIYAYVVPFVFSVFVACFLASLISGLTIILFKLRKTNELFQHPYLKQQAFERYSLSIRLSILMDYFFRISLPNSRFWLIGDANRMLQHVDPKSIPSGIKWPLIGLWGGCYVGLIAMVVLWSFLLLKM
ncbi:hypothetical protein LSG25_09145 [Paralcaligenes sp. KSB-10]|jgi:hypothetical protein|uniref:hypothetical protein n=1 Tax=Paralcaligenes sp. KSB-10 TaxID=2901142 RepID=UPI001E594751|nr:hypothetical protein [Paralcaligenes sp. KSB-10]UHL66002.1 hypothetical protein LSG25_09145 [Paralcaligenes sp. KSB-10]